MDNSLLLQEISRLPSGYDIDMNEEHFNSDEDEDKSSFASEFEEEPFGDPISKTKVRLLILFFPVFIMSIFVWNCQGAGSPSFLNFFRFLMDKHKPDFVVLLERQKADEFIRRPSFFIPIA